MGHDYSYSQDSESDHYTEDSVEREMEAYIRMDEAQSAFNSARRHEEEIEVGFPNRCYCGGQPLIKTSYTRNDPGRKYYTCENVDDGECHLHKWWDVAVTEEMGERARVVRKEFEEIREEKNKTEEKVVHLENLIEEIGDELKRSRATVRKVLGLCNTSLMPISSM